MGIMASAKVMFVFHGACAVGATERTKTTRWAQATVE